MKMKYCLFLYLCVLFLFILSCQRKEPINESNIITFDNIESENIENTIENIIDEPVSIPAPTIKHLPYYEAYQFNPGEYYTLDAPIQIMSQPNLEGEVLGTIGLNEKINILSVNFEVGAMKIDDVSALWYNIEYNGINGYIWGGLLSAGTLVHDIDNNGIDDYFHYRVSAIQGPHFYYVNTLYDVFIYLNNERISTEDMFVIHPDGGINRVCGSVHFEVIEDDKISILMYFGSPGGIYRDYFEIDSEGRIIFIESDHEIFTELE